MIFDCYLANHESDLREIRMAELAPLDVTHIQVEAPYTFTGLPKECWSDSWKYEGDPSPNPWINEANLRNHIKTVLEREAHPNDDDIILISDLDEIPKVSAIAQYRPEMGICALEMDVNWFYLNTCNIKRGWRIAKIMPWAYLKNTTPQAAREQGCPIALLESGWHFSYQGGPEAIERKLASFSHQEPEVKEAVRNTKLGDIVPMNELPLYVQQNQERFKHMLYVE